MMIPRIYFKILVFYGIVLAASGLLLESALWFPGIAGHGANVYVMARILHEPIFQYGIVLNVLPALVFILTSNNPTQKNQRQNRHGLIFFWFFQGVVVVEILANLLNNLLGGALTWYTRFLSLGFPIALGWFLLSRIYHNLVYKTNQNIFPINLDYAKTEVVSFFIETPLVVYGLFFLLIPVWQPGGSVGIFGMVSPAVFNLVQVAWHIFSTEYFAIIFISGVFYLAMLQGRLLLPGQDFDNTVLARVRRAWKLQWSLVALFFFISLYYQLKYFIIRENIPAFSGLWVFLLPLSYGLSLGVFRYVYKAIPVEERFGGLVDFAFLFLILLVMAQSIQAIFAFLNGQNMFAFTEWMAGSRHLFAVGVVFPVLFLFWTTLQPGGRAVEKSWLIFWWIFTLALVLSSWVMGTLETGLWYKTDDHGFFQYPGWIAIVEILRPWHMARWVILTFFALVVIVALIAPGIFAGKLPEKRKRKNI